MNAPFNPRAHTRQAFSAYLADVESEDCARATADAFGWPLEHIHSGGLRAAIQALAVAASPSVVLVDVSDSGNPMDDMNGLAEVCEPGTIVIACGRINDIGFYRDLLNFGIHDYLPKPFTPEQLQAAITAAQAAVLGAGAAEGGSEVPHVMTAVVGVRGGVGCSAIAVSLAWSLSERKRSTALLDLDVHFGTGALALDLEPGRGLTDAIENPSRIDGLFIERALVRHNEKLGVLSAEAPLSQPLTGDGAAFYQLQDELRGAFACTVLDLPRHMLVQHPTLLHDSAAIVVVTELTLAATRDTIRILSWLKSNVPNGRVILVANRVPAAGQEEVGKREFEKSIERKLDVVLPADPKLAIQAAKLGKPLAEVAKAAKLGQALAPLTDMILGENESGRKQGSSLFSRLNEVKTLLPKRRKA